jgi:DNA-binding response OmpR family regulator
MILVSEGFDVHTAASRKAAKAALAQSSYEIVVTDLQHGKQNLWLRGRSCRSGTGEKTSYGGGERVP